MAQQGDKSMLAKEKSPVIQQMDFVLQKFLQQSFVLDDKGKILDERLDDLWRDVNLKKVYQKILTTT